jgi:hypothetical protein
MKNLKSLKTITLTLGVFLLVFFAFSFAAVHAIQGQSAACDGVNQVTGNTGNNACSPGGSAGKDSINTLAGQVVGVISIIAGIIAVIMIIVAGIKYTTSGGESGAVSSAKTTLVYALIGIAVAALAQVLVHTVLSATNV